MMVNNRYRTSHIIWSYHCETIMRAVKAKSELSYSHIIYSREYFDFLSNLDPCAPRVLCLGSGLTWDVLCPAHDAITSSLSLSVTLVTSRDTALALHGASVWSQPGECTDIVTLWHCEGLWHCDNFCDVMTEYEEYNGKSGGSEGAVLWVARCFYFRKIG